MNTLIQVFVRHVYGKALVYPANSTARKFSDLLAVKSFTRPQLQGIEALGFQIEQVADPATRRAA